MKTAATTAKKAKSATKATTAKTATKENSFFAFAALVALVAFFAFVANPLYSEDISINAAVDKNTVALNGQITLQVFVSGGTNLPDPQLPSLANFSVYSTGKSESLSIINGQFSSFVTYTYVLTPRFVGKTEIGPITVNVQGRTYQTLPIEIHIVRPAGTSSAAQPAKAAPSQGPGGQAGGPPDLFVTAELDKKKAYVNEQVTLTVRFYTGVNLLGNPEYVPPATSGFFSEDLPPRYYNASYQGRSYYVMEIKSALFPTSRGEMVIGSGRIRCQVQENAAIDPFASDFFQKFFSQGLLSGQTKELRTDPVVLQVLSIPSEGRPSSFTGAVGSFDFKAELDKKQLKVGEALGLTLIVEGNGNLQTISAPRPAEMKEFRTYDTVSSLSVRKDKDTVHGTKVFKTVLVPRTSGKISIAPIAFSYFDPQIGKFIELHTRPAEVQVLPGPSSPAAAAPMTTAPLQTLTPISQDIRFIKEKWRSPMLSRLLTPLSRQRKIHMIPLLLFLLLFSWTYYQGWRSKDAASVRKREALSRAKGFIRQAEKAWSRKETDMAAVRLADALSGYLADKMSLSEKGLTWRETSSILRQKHPVPEELIQSLQDLWQEIETLRFAPGALKENANHFETSRKLWEMLKQMEKKL